MTEQKIDALIQGYLELCPAEPVPSEVLEEIEVILGVVLPADLKKICTVFPGSTLTMEHYLFRTQGDYGVVENTLSWRRTVGLPARFVALAELDESIVVLETTASVSSARVLWFNSVLIRRLADEEDVAANSSYGVDVFASYADYFAYMIEAEREDRTGL